MAGMRVAVVTGAGRGIGRAIASGLASAGYGIVATARTRAQVDDTVAAIRQGGGGALAVAGDVVNQGTWLR